MVAALPGGGEARPGQARWPAVAERSRPGATWSCGPAPAPARRSATWCPPSSPASGSSSPPPPRRCRTSWPAKDLPVPRRAPRPPVHLGGAQGPVQLRVRAAPGRGRPRGRLPTATASDPRAADRRPAGARRARRAGRPRRAGRHRRVGGHAPTPATGPSSPSSPSDAAWAAVSTTSRDCPGAARCPRGDRLLHRGGPGPGGRRPTSWWSTCTSTGSTWPATARSCPSTTSPSSTRRTCSTTSSRPPPASRSAPGGSRHLARLLRGILAEAGDHDHRRGRLRRRAVAGALGAPPRPAADRPAARRPGRRPGGRPAAGSRPRRRRCATSPTAPATTSSARAIRARQAATALLDDIDAVDRSPTTPTSCWSTGPEHAPALRLAPIDVAGLLRERAVVPPHRGADQRHPRAGLRAARSGCPSGPTSCSTSAARSTTRPTASSTAPPACPAPPNPGGPTPPSTSWPRSSRPRAGARSPCSPATGRWTAPSTRSATGCRTRCSPRATCPSRRSSSGSPASPRPACSPR